MKNIYLGAGFLLVSAVMTGYWYFNPSFTPSNSYWIQTLVAAGGGVFMIGSEVLPKILKSKNLNMVDETKPAPVVVDFSPDNFEQEDFRCLIHLRNRVLKVKSKEGVDAVNKLNAIIFALKTSEDGK